MRNMVITTLLIMIVCFLFDILTWGLRYYALLFYLVIMSIHHLRSLNNCKHDTYTVSKKKIWMKMVLFTFVMIPVILFPEYKPLQTTGGYQVKTSTIIIEDDSRFEAFTSENDHRQVGVHMWYPDTSYEDEVFPLIIYSHGGISLNTSNESLFLELASHGYIVFSIDHMYHSIVAQNNEGKNVWIDSGYMQELNRENAKEFPEESFVLYQKWMEQRMGDIHFLIDYTKMNEQSNEGEAILKHIDKENIGVIGHSLGGSAALCIGRERSDVKVVIALESPYMCDIIGVEDGMFLFEDNPYPLPVLHIYSDSTWADLSILPQYKQNELMLSSNDSIVKNIHIAGTGHFSLTDLSQTSPIITRLLNGFHSIKDSKEVLYIINKESLDFLDEYLK